MDNSYMLRQHLLPQREKALALDRSVRGVYESAKETTRDIYDGFERLSWRTSCLIDGYEDVCQEIKIEDRRFINALVEVYNRKDVICDMLVLYVEYILKDKERTESKSRTTTRFTSKKISELLAGVTTKKAIAYSIGKSLADSPQISISIRKTIYSKGALSLTGVEIYGLIQKAAMAARKLRTLEPAYYNILYYNRIEMLYLYVDPILSVIIKELKSKYNATLEEVMGILERFINP